jgi:hypothetical protein
MTENPAVSQQAEEMVLKTIKCEFKSHLPDHLIEKLIFRGRLFADCFIWIGAGTTYGKIKYEGKAWDVHRLVGHFLFGPLKRKDDICHINNCHSTLCFRATHLYKGTRSSNMKDAVEKGTFYPPNINKFKTHCKNGHEFNSENTRIEKDGRRDCRICNRNRMRDKRLGIT